MVESVGPAYLAGPILASSLGIEVEEMFEKAQIDALFEELDREWRGKPDFEQISRAAHLGVAYWDAGRPLDKIDSRAVALIEKHKPKA
jgi:hypothetical protein